MQEILFVYDTLLYGNGLTIAIFNRLITINQNIENFSDFFNRFLFDQTMNKNDFYSILDSNTKSDVYLEKDDIVRIETFIKSHINDINKHGFEVWIGEKAFVEEVFLVKNSALYFLSLFNYWYIHTDFDNPHYYYVYKDCVDSFLRLGIKDMYTLNYDCFLDSFCNIKHSHGAFLNNFYDLIQMAHFRYNGENVEEYLHPCCIGTNGLEKCRGLCMLNESLVSGYDYEFLFSNNKHFGNLLIYGVRFADSLMIPESIKQKYSEQDIRLMKYVDGHILLRLDALYLNNLISSITVSYYQDSDLIRYKKIFKECACNHIVKYVKSNEIY